MKIIDLFSLTLGPAFTCLWFVANYATGDSHMRSTLLGILILLFANPVTADTTNRALQVSPVPGLFVGGVGLLCESSGNDDTFVLLTKDRETAGSAIFDGDDVSYEMMSLIRKTPDIYAYGIYEALVINRQSLALKKDGKNYLCEIQSIGDLHKSAEMHLQMLLRKNKI